MLTHFIPLENSTSYSFYNFAAAGTGFFGLTPIVRSCTHFASYLSNVPFTEATQEDPSHVVLYLSKSAPVATAVNDIQSKASAGESVIQMGDTVWIHFPKGIGTSKLSPTVIDRSIGSPATRRNWNTLVKMRELSRTR